MLCQESEVLEKFGKPQYIVKLQSGSKMLEAAD